MKKDFLLVPSELNITLDSIPSLACVGHLVELKRGKECAYIVQDGLTNIILV